MDPAPALEVEVRTLRSGRVCVAAAGEIDISSVDVLKHALATEVTNGERVLLDLSAVTFIDSTGLAAIIGALNDSRETGAEIETSSDLPEQARRLFELTGTLPLLRPSAEPRSSNGNRPDR